jgi:hypothetical protein
MDEGESVTQFFLIIFVHFFESNMDATLPPTPHESKLLCFYCAAHDLSPSELAATFAGGTCVSCGVVVIKQAAGAGSSDDGAASYGIGYKKDSAEFANQNFQRDMQSKGAYLTSLDLATCKALTPKALESAAEHCTGLQLLNLADCVEVNNSSFLSIVARNASTLQLINISVKADLSSLLTDNAVVAMAESCSRLVSLNVACTLISDTGIQAVIKFLPKIEDLQVSGCSGLTDDAFVGLGSNCRNVRTLRLRGCHLITDKTLNEVQALANLTALDLRKCSRITDAGLAPLACLSLQFLDVRGCQRLQDKSVEAIAVSPALNTLFLEDCENLTVFGQQLSSVDAIRAYYLELTSGKLKVAGVAESPLASIRCSEIAAKSPRLVKLTVADAISITDTALRNVGANCPCLQKFDCSGCPLLGAAGVLALGWGCAGLLELKMAHLPLLTDEVLMALAGDAKRVQRELMARLGEESGWGKLALDSHEWDLPEFSRLAEGDVAVSVVRDFTPERIEQELEFRNLVEVEGAAQGDNHHVELFDVLCMRLEEERQLRRLQRATKKPLPSLFERPLEGGGGDDSAGDEGGALESSLERMKSRSLSVLKAADSIRDHISGAISSALPFVNLDRTCLVPDLQLLDVSGCRQISTKGILSISRFCNLKHLACWRLSRATSAGCSSRIVRPGVKGKITEELSKDLREIVENCPDLTNVDFDEVKGLDDKVIEEIANNCAQLRYCDISFAAKVNDASVKLLVEKCPKLVGLKVENATLLTLPEKLKNTPCANEKERKRHTQALKKWFISEGAPNTRALQR